MCHTSCNQEVYIKGFQTGFQSTDFTEVISQSLKLCFLLKYLKSGFHSTKLFQHVEVDFITTSKNRGDNG